MSVTQESLNIDPEQHPYRVEIKEGAKDEQGKNVFPQISVRATGESKTTAVEQALDMYKKTKEGLER